MGCRLLLDSPPFQTAAIMRACAPSGRLRRELIEGNEPVGELGRHHAAWLAERGRSA